jgi:hypothetical protein
MRLGETGRTRLLHLIIFVALLLCGAWITSQAWTLSHSVMRGSPGKTYATPLYDYWSLPEGLPFDASGKFGADYACLFFSAKNLSMHSVMYSDQADPFNRPAVTFPPHLIYGTAHSLAHFSFPKSVLLSNYLQIVVFLGAFAWFLRGSPANPMAIAGGTVGIFFCCFALPLV